MTEFEDARIITAASVCYHYLATYQLVGLGGEKAQEVFAGVMDTMLTEFIGLHILATGKGPSLISRHLQQWISDVFAKLAVQVLAIITYQNPASGPDIWT
ncbi:hypothetical protein GCM10020218_070210 [Dactylosporangium vinaceum]